MHGDLMPQNVLDGVMEIEAKAAKLVDDAKAKARERHGQVKAELEALAATLDAEAEETTGEHARAVDARRAEALAALDGELEAALAAIGTVKAERVAPLAEEVARLLEQRADGH